MSELASVKVFRFDPTVDQEGRYETYDGIPYQNRTVLEVIKTIYEEYDPTLAFREGCDNGTCSSCALIVNNEPVLACQTLAGKEMLIAPHPKFEIIKDLVIDFNKVKG